jgi:low affinity Fe/Cu permease
VESVAGGPRGWALPYSAFRVRRVAGRVRARHAGGHDPDPFRMRDLFRRFAAAISNALGSPWAFFSAVLVVVAWAAFGPVLGYSDHWQLLINTGTTILTFLMVFLIQNTQNRDAKAINLKLDELLRAIDGARTGMVNLASLSDEELLQLEQELTKLGEREGLPSIRERRANAARKAAEERALREETREETSSD